MSNDWGAWVPADVAYRRAGGRRHYNAWRQFMAIMRRRKVGKMLLAGKKQVDIARALGVHRSTISRDVTRLRELDNRRGRCPICGQIF